MKTLSTFALLIFVTVTPLFSQMVWDKSYSEGYCQKIVETEEGGYFAISDYTYVKIASNGDTIFTHKTAGVKDYDRNFISCAYLHDGLIAVAFTLTKDSNSTICILNKVGKIIASKKFTNSTIINDMVNVDNQIYFALSGGSNALVSFYSSQLDYAWRCENNAKDAMVKLCINKDKNIVSMTSGGRIIIINSITGRIEFSKKALNRFYPDYYKANSSLSLYQMNNFYYLQDVNMLHTKISLIGDSITSKKLFEAGPYDSGKSIADENGFTFLYTPRNDFKWKLVKTDENYQVIDSASFDVKKGFKTTCILLKDSFGNYLLGGNIQSGGDMRILKYKWNKPTNTANSQQSEFSCYHDQMHERILINSISSSKNFNAEIFNSLSNLIFSQNFFKENEFHISTSGYIAGIYLVRISSDGNQLYTTKIQVK